jgi:hypothetical protein
MEILQQSGARHREFLRRRSYLRRGSAHAPAADAFGGMRLAYSSRGFCEASSA